jgi:ribosomal protein S27AE
LELRKKVEVHTWGDILEAADAGDLEILCDKCHEPIIVKHGRFPGVLVLGNIYAANQDFAHNLGGIIGDNFPHWSDEGQDTSNIRIGDEFKFSWLEVRVNAFHVTCLCDMLKEAFDGYVAQCPRNCGGQMILCEDQIHFHCDKCGYDPRMEDHK